MQQLGQRFLVGTQGVRHTGRQQGQLPHKQVSLPLGAKLLHFIGKLLHLGSAAQLPSDFLQGMLGVVVGSGRPHQAVHHRGFHQKGIVRCAL